MNGNKQFTKRSGKGSAANALVLVDTLLRKKNAGEQIDMTAELKCLHDIRSCLLDVMDTGRDTPNDVDTEESIDHHEERAKGVLTESMHLLNELNQNLESIAVKMETAEKARLHSSGKPRNGTDRFAAKKRVEQVFSAELTALR